MGDGEAWQDPGFDNPPHTHDEAEAFYVLEGSYTLYTHSAPAEGVGPGTFVFIPPGAVHVPRSTFGPSWSGMAASCQRTGFGESVGIVLAHHEREYLNRRQGARPACLGDALAHRWTRASGASQPWRTPSAGQRAIS